MTNLDRVLMEITFDFSLSSIEVYLEENGLIPEEVYNPESNTNKKGIYAVCLQVLENVSQDINLMKSYKLDDMTVSDFYDNLMNKIDALQRKIRMMSVSDDTSSNSNTFMLFSS